MSKTMIPGLYRRRGFTLVELIVVIAIIGVLSTLVFTSFKGARVESRDAKRLSDLNTIRTALEAFYNYNHYYPTFITGMEPIQTDDGRVFLDATPTNPEPRTDHQCPDSDYVYTVGPDNKSYSLTTCINGQDAALPKTVSAMERGVFHCGDKVTDRDGFTYPTVQVNTQCWMAENLKTKTWPDGTALTMASNTSERDCITEADARGTESDCEAGRTLYAAYINSSVCPTGWHIPSDAEFVTLEQSLTDSGQSCAANRGWSGSGVCLNGIPAADACFNAGQKLKAGGSVGFNWQLTGARYASPFGNAVFSEAGDTGYLLSTSSAVCGMPGPFGAAAINVRSVNTSSNGIQRQRLGHGSNPESPSYQLPAAPIRCIKD